SVASRFRKSDSTAVCPPASGSKKIAKDRPICMPIRAPAMSTAANTMRIMKPIAMPMKICWPKITSPRPEFGGTSGIGGMIGSTATVTAMPIASRARTDTPRLANTGAEENNPSSRASGNISAASHASSWAAVTLSIGRRSGGACGGAAALTDHRRDGLDQPAHEVRQQGDHPRPGKHEGDEDRDQLGHEGECHLVDLGRG